MRIEEIVEIDRPPEEVFSYVTNPENLPEWSNLVLEVRRETEGDLREGDRFPTAAKFLGRRFETPFEVSAHEPHRRHSDTSRGGPFEQEYTYAFEERISMHASHMLRSTSALATNLSRFLPHRNRIMRDVGYEPLRTPLLRG